MAKILTLTCFIFPDSEKYPAWKDKLEHILISPVAMPADVGSSRVADGQKVSEMINGPKYRKR